MSTPTRHDTSDVTFLVSGMDRPCECPQEQGRGQQHDDDLDLDLDLDLEANNTDEWREGSYTGLLMMEVDMIITPPDTNTVLEDQNLAHVDTQSIEVSFDVGDLSERDMDLGGQVAVRRS